MANPPDDDRRSGSGDDDRSARKQDLRATTDSIQSDAARLAEIEREKGEMEAADQQVDALSSEAVKVSDGIARKTRAERELNEGLA